jgi:hypothetical protein
MQRRIASLDDIPTSILDDYPLYLAYNVTSIEPVMNSDARFGWLVTESERSVSEHLYLYLDGAADDPFGHWVFESGIFLPLFHRLKTRYPTIHLFSTNPKQYKEVFYKGFGIDTTDVVSAVEANNTVIFTQWNSLGDHDITRRTKYCIFLDSFYKSLISPLGNVDKTIDILYLPRGVKENFKINDRHIPAQRYLLDKIQSFFPTTVIYNTDTTTNIREQIQLVRSSKIILLDYGSSLLVNGFFAENSNIIVIGDFGHVHCTNPKPYMMLQETLKRGCNYMYLPIDCPAMYLLQVIYETIQHNFQPHTHIYNCWKKRELNDCHECLSNPL